MLLALLLAFVLQGPDLNESFRREVRDGHYAEAETLLANPDVDPDARDEDGWTALMYAARSDRPEFVTLLVKADANLDLQNEDGETALIIAVRRGRVDEARLLLMAGADESLRDAKGRTALDWANDQKRLYLAQIIHIASEPSSATVTVAERPVTVGDETLVPPKLLKETPPLYTEDAFQRGIEGRVVLKVIVRKDGRVGAIRVHQSLDGDLDAAAVEAVKTWTFEPARVDGEPINVFTDIDIDFSLKHKT
jgi:TonB family protein